jgi:predicted  nucleic acid-binding Zn-ribbon protein
MSKDITLEPTAGEAADIEEAAKALVAEMKRANKKMESDQREIDRLKAQTRATLSKLKAA